MRFLVFSLVVGGALFYVLTSDHGPKQAGQFIGETVASAKPVVAAAQEMAHEAARTMQADPAPRVPPVPPAVVLAQAPQRNADEVPPAPAPIWVAAPRVAPVDPEVTSPAQQRVAQVAVAGTQPISDPAVLARRTEVLGAGAANQAPSPPAFMSAGQRRQELGRLAHDMDMLFAKKVGK